MDWVKSAKPKYVVYPPFLNYEPDHHADRNRDDDYEDSDNPVNLEVSDVICHFNGGTEPEQDPDDNVVSA